MKRKSLAIKKQGIITALVILLAALVVVNQFLILSSPKTGMSTQVNKQNVAQAGMTDYGISMDKNGYEVLLGYDNSITLNANQMKNYVGLNIALPCCGVKTLIAKGNCQCGHHVAMSGLAKFLAQKGYTKDQIQVELDKWKLVFYPQNKAGNTGAC